MSVGKIDISKMSVILTFIIFPVDQKSVNQMFFGQNPVGQMSFGQMSVTKDVFDSTFGPNLWP
jgi:hypothetical protein